MTVAHRRAVAASSSSSSTPPAEAFFNAAANGSNGSLSGSNGSHNDHLHPPHTTNNGNTVKRRKKFRSRTLSSFYKKSSLWLSTYGFLVAAGCVLFGCAVIVIAKMLLGNDTHLPLVGVFYWSRRLTAPLAPRFFHPRFFHATSDKRHSPYPVVTEAPDAKHGVKKWFYQGPENKERFPKRDPSKVYAIPGAMSHIGDKSDEYAQLRKDYDEIFPPGHPERSLQAVKQLQLHKYETMSMSPEPLQDGQDLPNAEPYDIYDCPDKPPPNYPYTWNLVKDVLGNWPTDDIEPRKQIYQSLCVFDYVRDYDKAMAYRKAELPFVVTNDPEVAEAVERWNTPGFLGALMGDVMHRCEYSRNNHFLYWVQVAQPRRLRATGENPLQNWTAPTELLRMRFTDWLKHANVTDVESGPDRPHWYYRLIGCGEMGYDCDAGSSEYLFDEFTFFQPRPDQLYLDEYQHQKGIHCRFGMKGVIAENHYDVGRNAIALLGGERRYILAHPNQCQYLCLYPNTHPSARHSAVDWSQPDLQQYPDFAQARANEVVLQAGDVMYLPTNWFHYIISMEMNYQCNTRSGVSYHYHNDLKKCGFWTR